MYNNLENLMSSLDAENIEGAEANAATDETLMYGDELDLSCLEFSADVQLTGEADLLIAEAMQAETERSIAHMDNLLNTLEAARDQGGIKGTSIQAVTNWYNDISASLGEYASEIPSVESFGEEGGAIAEADNMITAVKGNVDRLKAAGKKVIEKIIDAFKKIYMQLTDRATKLEAAISKAEAAIKKMKLGDVHTIKNKTLNLGEADNTEVADGADALDPLNDIAEGKALAGVVEEMQKAFYANKKADYVAARNGLYKAIEKDFGKLESAKDPHIKKAGIKAASYTAIKITPTIGAYRLLVAFPEAGSSLAPIVKLISLNDKVKEVAHVHPTQPLAIARKAVETVKRLTDAGEAATKKMEGKDVKELGEVKDLAQNLEQTIKFVLDLYKEASVRAFQIGRANAKYSQKCAANMGKAPKSVDGKDDESADDKKDDKKDDKSDDK